MEETQTTQEEVQSVFDEANNMSPEMAINILIQVAGLAQETGKLNIRDSVLLAKAISTIRPGSI